MIGGSVLGLIVVIATIIGQCGGTAPKAKLTADASVAALKAPDTNLDQQIARANDLIASGQTTAALDQLLSARRVFPKDARLAYLAGKIYFERQWWTVGLKQFRDVLGLDPTYRADPEMIKIVL